MYQEVSAAGILTMLEPTSAEPQPATKSPGTSNAVKPSMAAFMTKRNKPSRMSVNGMANTTTLGLTRHEAVQP